MSLIPTAADRWVDDTTGQESIALGNGAMPLNYRDGGQWKAVDLNWQNVGSMYRASRSFHKAALVDNTLGIQWPTRSGLRTIKTRPHSLIRFDPSNRSWEQLSAANQSPVVTMSGATLTQRDVYPDIHRRIFFFNHRLSDGYVFTQAARDRLRAMGGWAGKWLGTVSRLDVSGIAGAEIFDDDGTVAPDDVGKLTNRFVGYRVGGERIVNMMGRQRIIDPMGRYTGVVVRRLIVVRNGDLFIVELFDPAVADALPAGDFRHNDEFGYNGEGSSGTSIEDVIVGGLAAPASSGTVTAIWVIINKGGKTASGLAKAALYQQNAGDDTLVTDSETDELSIGFAVDPPWREFTFTGGGPSVTAGTDYYISVWGEEGGVQLSMQAELDGEVGETYTFESQTYASSWPTPFALTDLSNNRVAAYAVYTPSAAGPPLGGLALLGVGR